jgi:hypothetical protein
VLVGVGGIGVAVSVGGTGIAVSVGGIGVAVSVGGFVVAVDVAPGGIGVDETPQADKIKPKNDVPLNFRKSRRRRCLNLGSYMISLFIILVCKTPAETLLLS